jgi:hypothetical protein
VTKRRAVFATIRSEVATCALDAAPRSDDRVALPG